MRPLDKWCSALFADAWPHTYVYAHTMYYNLLYCLAERTRTENLVAFMVCSGRRLKVNYDANTFTRRGVNERPRTIDVRTLTINDRYECSL